MLAGVKAADVCLRDLAKEVPLLQELELQQCGLQELAAYICSLGELRKIDVASNSITEVFYRLAADLPNMLKELEYFH